MTYDLKNGKLARFFAVPAKYGLINLLKSEKNLSKREKKILEILERKR